MEYISLSCDQIKESTVIQLNGSKSISNRVLIIKHLCEQDFAIHNLSVCEDTDILHKMLNSGEKGHYNAGHAGTSYRFMTAYLALQAGTQILTGSERMKNRPIGPLVEALNQLGCNIAYLGKQGYPPLKILAFNSLTNKKHIRISGSTSSQYLSALLMVGSKLPEGLIMEIQDDLVSRPYLEMTLSIMKHFGVNHEWVNPTTIFVPNQAYKPKEYTIEADWSAASYYYGILSTSSINRIGLKGLLINSLQGDSAMIEIGKKYGIHSYMDEDGILWLQKQKNKAPKHLEFNLLKTPDLAQTLAVMSAVNGIETLFSGLQTLKIKETDRISALRAELAKVKVSFSVLPSSFSRKKKNEYYILGGIAQQNGIPRIFTYQDHRMAMAFSMLAIKFPIEIENPMVINKSYPGFWKDLEKLGFLIKS